MNRFLALFWLLFFLAPIYPEGLTIQDVAIDFPVPKGFILKSSGAGYFKLSKSLGSSEIRISISYNKYREILDQMPMERSPFLYSLLTEKGSITKADILRLLDEHASPVLFTESPYSAYSVINRFHLLSGEVGEKCSIMSLDSFKDHKELSDPFIFFSRIALTEGILEVYVIAYNRDKTAKEAAMRSYGELINGNLKYVDQSQVDRIFTDIYSGKFHGLSSVIEAYSAYEEILSSLEIKQLK